MLARVAFYEVPEKRHVILDGQDVAMMLHGDAMRLVGLQTNERQVRYRLSIDQQVAIDQPGLQQSNETQGRKVFGFIERHLVLCFAE